MTRIEMINYIINYYNEHFKWQKLVYGQEIDEKLVEKLTNEELENFINQNCKEEK